MRFVRSAIVVTGLALAIAATPSNALNKRPHEPASSSSSSSSGGSGGATPVPEPGMAGIMGLALLGLAYGRRRNAIAKRG